jgi:hypothetical protein
MMGIAGRRRRRSAAGGTLLALVLLPACTVIPARLSGNRYVYEDLPAGGGFPVDENILIGYVDAQDVRAMRAHAWTLANVVLTSPESGGRLPPWRRRSSG